MIEIDSNKFMILSKESPLFAIKKKNRNGFQTLIY